MNRTATGARLGLVAVLLLAPLAFGAVHRWAIALVEIAIWALAYAWFVGGLSRKIPRKVAWGSAALCLYLALQTVPLPPGLLSALSPATAGIYARSVDSLSLTEPAPSAIRSAGKVEDGRVSVSERERLGEIAANDPAWFPRAWRSLALYPFEARSDLLRYLAYAVVIWLAATLPAPALLLRAAVAAGFAIACLAVVGYASWNGRIGWILDPYDWDPSRDYPRMLGPFVNPDHLAAFLAMTVAPTMLLLALRQWPGTSPKRSNPARPLQTGLVGGAILATGLAIVVAALVGSGSRAGLVAAILGATVFWWGAARRVAAPSAQSMRGRVAGPGKERTAQFLRRCAPAALTLAIVVGGFIYAGSSARGTLEGRLGKTVEKTANLGSDPRFALWRQSLPILADFPLFGVGAGNWREVFRRYRRYPVAEFRPNHVHNDYLEWLIEVGGIGLAFTVALGLAYAGWMRRNHEIPRVIRWGILGGITATVWHEAVDFGLRVPANAILFSVLLGLACNREWSNGALPPRRRKFPAIVAASAAFAVLTVMSARELLEFLQWQEAREGRFTLDLEPRDAETWHQLGFNLHRAGFRYLPPTEECFRKAVRLRPTAEKSYWHLYLAATTEQEKLEAIEAAVFLDPVRVRWRIAYARSLASLGRKEAALAQVEEAVLRDPLLDHHPYLAGKVDPSGDVLGAAERGFTRALAVWSHDAVVIGNAARFYLRFGMWKRAAELWVRAAVVEGDWSRHGLRAGESYARAGDQDLAEETIRRAIRDDPESPDGYRLLALAVMAPKGDYGEAEQTLELGLRQSKDHAPLLLAFYEIRRDSGDPAGALQALARAADLERRDARLQYRLGRAYLDAEDYHRAVTALDRALALDPKRAAIHHSRGTALEKLHDLTGAKEAYRRAVELEPGNQAYRRSLDRIESVFREAVGPVP